MLAAGEWRYPLIFSEWVVHYLEAIYQKMRTVLFEVEKLREVDGDYKKLIHKAQRETEEINEAIKQDDQDRVDDLIISMKDPSEF